jgi:hypothetical protein
VNNAKLGVLGGGLIGLLGCFLPLVSAEGVSMSFWDMHSVAMGQTLIVMIGFAIPLAMGVMAMKGTMLRWQAIVALLGFAFVVFKFRGGFLDLITHGAIGAKLMGIGAVVGLIAAIICVAKPAPKA